MVTHRFFRDELALGLVGRACDEANSKTTGWKDVCSALLAVAFNFAEWKVEDPYDDWSLLKMLPALVKEVKKDISYHSELKEIFPWEAALKEVFKQNSRLSVLIWLNEFLEKHDRNIVQEIDIPTGHRFDEKVAPETYRVSQSLEKVKKDLTELKKRRKRTA